MYTHIRPHVRSSYTATLRRACLQMSLLYYVHVKQNSVPSPHGRQNVYNLSSPAIACLGGSLVYHTDTYTHKH